MSKVYCLSLSFGGGGEFSGPVFSTLEKAQAFRIKYLAHLQACGADKRPNCHGHRDNGKAVMETSACVIYERNLDPVDASDTFDKSTDPFLGC